MRWRLLTTNRGEAMNTMLVVTFLIALVICAGSAYLAYKNGWMAPFKKSPFGKKDPRDGKEKNRGR